jgi:hypothetical protein
MAYLDQTPGAHLIYDVRKHHISVVPGTVVARQVDGNFSRRSKCRSTWRRAVKVGSAISSPAMRVLLTSIISLNYFRRRPRIRYAASAGG